MDAIQKSEPELFVHSVLHLQKVLQFVTHRPLLEVKSGKRRCEGGGLKPADGEGALTPGFSPVLMRGGVNEGPVS